MRSHRGGLWLTRIAAGVAGPQRAIGPTRNARRHQSVTHVPTGTARAMPVPWAMSNAAFWVLWCFVFVLPWDVLTKLPVVGSIPRLVGLAASAVGVVYILARRRVRPLSWFHMFAVLFVLWAG